MSTEIIKVFFHMKLNIKLYHWSTFSYPRHKASDELFDKLLENIDRFVEVYIGKYTRPTVDEGFNISVTHYTETSILILLKTYVDYLTNDIPFILQSTDTELLNIRDEMLADLNQALYLFTLH